MRIIVEGNKTILQLLNINSLTSEVVPIEYKQSIYNKMYSFNESTYIYNTFTGLVALLEENDVDVFKNNNFSELNVEKLIFLIKNRLLVLESENEEKLYLQCFGMIRKLGGKEGFSEYTILPTTACNARCFYCFETNFVPENMSLNTAREVADYIIKTHNTEEIKILWFGGEPLCNFNVIDEICGILNENNINFSSKMLSNGILFTNDIIQKAKNNWKLKMVQITFDGMCDEHNKRKNFVTDFINPFETTVKAVKELVDNDIAVTIRINIDTQNFDSANSLIDYLYLNFSKYENFNVYPEMLYNSKEVWNFNRTVSENQGLFEKYTHLYNKVVDLGLYKSKKLKPKLRSQHCMADNQNAIVINQNGDLFLCDHCSAESRVGNIYSGITEKAVYDDWVNKIVIREKCENCCFLPICTPFSKCPDHIFNCALKAENTLKYKLLTLIKNS